MADHLYLDGSQLYHRHEDDRGIVEGDVHTCIAPVRALPVRAFDLDALAAHDDAIRQQQEAGEGEGPYYDPDVWDTAFTDPPEPGADVTTTRVLAGWTKDGTWRRYCSPERLAQQALQIINGVTS